MCSRTFQKHSFFSVLQPFWYSMSVCWKLPGGCWCKRRSTCRQGGAALYSNLSFRLLSCHTVNTPTFERCLCPKEVDTLRFKNEIWNRVAGDLCRIRRVRTVPSHIILYNLITCMQSAIGTFLQFSCMYALWRIHPVCFSPMGYSASLAWYWLTWKSALGIVLSCRLSWRRTTHNGSRTGDQSLHVDLEVLIYLYLILLAWKKQQARRILAISTQFNTSSQ